MTIGIVEWVQLRRLLRDASDAAVTMVDTDLVDAPTKAPEPVDRERVIEAGVTGFIVRFPDNHVLLGAISRVVGWRPNPAGSHHVPCTAQGIAGLLAFAEMYDFELTDGADAMVRQVIRESYRKGQWPRALPAATATAEDVVSDAGRSSARARAANGALGPASWARRHAKALLAAIALLYLVSPQLVWLREDDRAFLQPAPLGRDTSAAAVLAALERCGGTAIAPGAAVPPGCDATVQTYPGRFRLVLGTLNPTLRLAGFDTLEGARGFVICEPGKPFEGCWER